MAAAETAAAAAATTDVARPIPFIYVDDAQGKFIVNPEVEKILQNFEAPIAVISVVGMYRTGKSFLLNKLIGKGAFEVGPTVVSCTRGIWLWGEPIRINGMTVVFLDTEGTGSVNKDTTYDSRVFSLAILLSSHLIFNSVGAIDENSLNSLSLVTSLTKHIHVKSTMMEEDDGTSFASFFPAFLWVLRDFSLQLQNDGKQITPKQYLEESLQLKSGMSSAVLAKNRIREMISHFFQERMCMTLVRPLLDEAALQNISSLAEDQYRPEFRHDLDNLRKYLFSHLRPKSINNQNCNGSIFMGLAKAYVEAINTGQVPTIMSAWDNVVEVECRKAVEIAEETYSHTIREALHTHPLPMDPKGLLQLHQKAKNAALETFKKHIVGDNTEQFKEAVQNKIRKEKSDLKDNNVKAATQAATNLLKKLFGPLAAKAGECTSLSEIISAYSAAEEQYLSECKVFSMNLALLDHVRVNKMEAIEKVIANVTGKWEQQRDGLNKEISSLQQQLEKLKLEKDRDVELLNQKLAAKTQGLAESEQREAALKNDIKAQRAAAETEMHNVQAKFSEEKKELKQEISDLKKNEDQLEGKLSETQHQLVTANSEISRLNALMAQTAEFAKRQEEEWKEKEGGLKRLIEEAKEQGKLAVEEVKGRMATQKAEMEKIVGDLQEKLGKAEQSSSELRAALEQERALAATRSEFLSKSLEEATSRERQLRDKNAESNEAHIAEIQALREKHTSKIEKLMEEISDLKGKLSDAEHAIQSTKSNSELQGNMLNDRVASLQARLDKAEAKEKELQEDKKALKKKLKNEVQKTKDILEVQLKEAKQELSVAEAKQSETDAALKSLREKFEAETAEHQKAIDELTERMNLEKTELKKNYDKIKLEKESLEDSVKQIKSLQSAIKNLESEKDGLEKAASELVDELATERLSHEQELLNLRDLGPTASPSGLKRLFQKDQGEMQEKQKRLVDVANKMAQTVAEQQQKLATLQNEKKFQTKKLADYLRKIQDLERKCYRLEQELGRGDDKKEEVSSDSNHVADEDSADEKDAK